MKLGSDEMNAAVRAPVMEAAEFVKSHRIAGHYGWNAILNTAEAELWALLDSYHWVCDGEAGGASRVLQLSRMDFEVTVWHDVATRGTDPVTPLAHSGELESLMHTSVAYRARPSEDNHQDGKDYTAELLISDMEWARDVMISESIPVLHRIAMRCGRQNITEAKIIAGWVGNLIRLTEEAEHARRAAGMLTASDRCVAVQHHGDCCRWNSVMGQAGTMAVCEGNLAKAWNELPTGFSAHWGPLSDEWVVEISGPSGAVYPFMIAECLARMYSADYPLFTGAAPPPADKLFSDVSDEDLASMLMRLPKEHIMSTWSDESLKDGYLTADGQLKRFYGWSSGQMR